jgi:hypothetical protein
MGVPPSPPWGCGKRLIRSGLLEGCSGIRQTIENRRFTEAIWRGTPGVTLPSRWRSELELSARLARAVLDSGAAVFFSKSGCASGLSRAKEKALDGPDGAADRTFLLSSLGCFGVEGKENRRVGRYGGTAVAEGTAMGRGWDRFETLQPIESAGAERSRKEIER